MNASERSRVDEMIAGGMSLEALYRIFKDIDRNELKAVYDEYLNQTSDYVEEGINISMNCS